MNYNLFIIAWNTKNRKVNIWLKSNNWIFVRKKDSRITKYEKMMMRSTVTCSKWWYIWVGRFLLLFLPFLFWLCFRYNGEKKKDPFESIFLQPQWEPNCMTMCKRCDIRTNQPRKKPAKERKQWDIFINFKFEKRCIVCYYRTCTHSNKQTYYDTMLRENKKKTRMRFSFFFHSCGPVLRCDC